MKNRNKCIPDTCVAETAQNLPANSGDFGFIPGLVRSPRDGNGNSLYYSCLENPLTRAAWPATAHWATESQTRLSTAHVHTCTPRYQAPRFYSSAYCLYPLESSWCPACSHCLINVCLIIQNTNREQPMQ